MGNKNLHATLFAACLGALTPVSAQSTPYVKMVYEAPKAAHEFSQIAISRSGTVWVLNADAGGKTHALYAFAPSGALIGGYPATWNPMSSVGACWTARSPMSASQIQSAATRFQQCVQSNATHVNIVSPTGLAIDHNGNVWVVTDGRSSELYEISPGGSIVGKPAGAGMNARGLTIAPNGDIWVVTEASPKVDPSVSEPKTGSQSAIKRLWGGNTQLRVYNDKGTIVGKVQYMDFPISQPPSTIIKKTGDWHVFANLVFTASGNYTNLSATLATKGSEHRCTECVAAGAASTEGRLVRDFDLTSEPWDCEAETKTGEVGSGGGSGWRYAAFSPDGLLWRSWDAGMFAIDLRHGVVKHELCGKPFKLIDRFAISSDGTMWAYAPMEHGVIHFTDNGKIIRNFAGVRARDIAIDQDGNVWAVAAGRVVEIVGGARKPPYFPYDFDFPSAPQWP